MLKVLLSGCAGKMCRYVADGIQDKKDIVVVGGVDICRDMTASFPTFTNFEQVNVDCDVIIDFSNPSNLDDLLEFAINGGKAVVICTTGFNDAQIEKIKAASSKIAVFFSFNMSLGVNLLKSLAVRASLVLGDNFDVEIIEKHHNQKIDAPSGTAIMLADAITNANNGKYRYEYDRHQKHEKRENNEIGIHSVRGGNIVGEHEIIFAGSDEVLSLKHIAQSKSLFANGAIAAAQFICGKSAGLYDMGALVEQ